MIRETEEGILVVDDDEELRATIAEVLELNGLPVTTAASADQALKLLAEKRGFRLVMLDMVMPGTDGMSAIPLIRKILPRVPIIIMTAYSSVDNAVQAMRQGADDYITKPFRIEVLLTLVRRCLQEATFVECCENSDCERIFQGLANQLRRKVIVTLQQRGRMRFMELVRALEVEDHTKVNFHLKVLREAGFLEQDQDKNYLLTPAGDKAAACLLFISKNMGLEGQ